MANLLLRRIYRYGKLRVMTLAEYIKERGLNASQFAAELGVSPSAVTRWLNGERIAEDDTKLRIFEATDGKVTPNDLLGVNCNAA